MKCLLILPTEFYNFQEQLVDVLLKKNYEVSCINDEMPNSTLLKVCSKIGLNYINTKFSLKYFLNKFCNLQANHYDLVIIIRGRGLSKESLNIVKYYSRYTVGYNFDSFTVNPSPLNWLNECDNYCTFDPDDARKYNLPLVNLFADYSWSEKSLPQEKKYDVSCVMKAHSSRLEYISLFIKRFPQLNHFTYIYMPNFIIFFMLFIRNPIICFKLRSFIHFVPLGPIEYEKVLRSSNTTIDYAHDMQSGITKRCYEALACGVSIITNNSKSKNMNISTADSFLVIPLKKLKTEECSEIPAFCKKPGVVFERFANDFINDLIDGEKK